jgi:hypothetical protein
MELRKQLAVALGLVCAIGGFCFLGSSAFFLLDALLAPASHWTSGEYFEGVVISLVFAFLPWFVLSTLARLWRAHLSNWVYLCLVTPSIVVGFLLAALSILSILLGVFWMFRG